MLSLVRHGWRSWKRAKAVALLAATAMAVGIGSVTAIYTIVEGVLLRPVPWPDGDRFVSIFGAHVADPGHISSSSWPDLVEYERRTRSFDAFGAYLIREFTLTAPGEPQHLTGVEVAPAFVNKLGVSPVVGRWFEQRQAVGDRGAEDPDIRQAVISNALWKRLGGDPAIVGTTVTLDRRLYTVAGVMPSWFRLPIAHVDAGELRADVWVPLNPQGPAKTRNAAFYFCYARLKPGVAVAQADEDVKRVAAELAKEYPREHAGYTAVAVNLLEAIVREFRPGLLLLLGSAGLLLLITCANVAALLLARSVARARETAIRVAIGATVWQLAFQYLTEGFVVSLVGAAGGVFVSLALVRFVLSVAADLLPRAYEIGVNRASLVFAFGAAVISSLLLSLAPLWQALRTSPREALSDDVHASAGRRSRGLSRSLVIAEIGFAFILLTGSALILAHLDDLLRIRPGFDPYDLVTFELAINEADYPDMTRRAPYLKRLLQTIEEIPGVSHAAFANQMPIERCCYTTTLTADERPPDPRLDWSVGLVAASSGYFQTMRIPLLSGAVFQESNPMDEHLPGIVIDRAAAKKYWPDRDAVGAAGYLGLNKDRVKVLGVVGDVRNRGLAADAMPEIYVPGTVVAWNPLRFIVRSALAPGALVPELRRAVRRVDSAQAIYDIKTMDEIIQGSLVTERLESFLTSFFGMTALLLATLGVYGVVSYSVRHRTVEIGTRLALGAVRRDVLRLVVGDGLVMAAYGTGIGAVVAIGVAWLLRSKVFGMHVDDARPFLSATAIVAGGTALSCVFPAWQATLVSPMEAIRQDAGSVWRQARRRARAFATSMTSLMSGSEPVAVAAEGALLAGFVESSRRAGSFREAIAAALATLRETVNCEAAWLLEKGPHAEYRCVARNGDGKVEDCTVPANGLLIGRLTHFPLPLPLSDADFDAWSRWAAAQKPERAAEHAHESGCLRTLGVRLAVPLLAPTTISGVLLLGSPIGRSRFTDGERRLLQHCAAQLALMVENARLTDRIVEQEKLRRDVRLAAEVQKRLLPEKPPSISGVSVTGMSLPARSIGGDYYDFLELGPDRLGIALADVAGKGVPAALIMSVVQASLRILAAEDGVSLPSLAARMNHYLHRSIGANESSSYATFFYAQIEDRGRRLRYVNAGHNPPYLLRYTAQPEERAIEDLSAGGTVIGLFPQNSYEEATVALGPGDVLMAFTDGVIEALNPADEEFGENRLRQLLRAAAHLSVDEMASRISEALKNWIADAVQYDDLTFILVKVDGGA